MRYNNGHVDNGNRIRGSGSRCPNCKADTYIETVSREYCSSCGLECDYWGKGSNEVYEQYMERQYINEHRKERERMDRESREWIEQHNAGWNDYDD